MKKAFVLFFAISMVSFTFGTISVYADTSGFYTYTVSNGMATISDVDTSISGDITIPDILGGYPVTIIGNAAFYGCTGLTSITIPNSVTKIGCYAFCECTRLKSITLSEGVTGLGEAAFSDCTALETVYYNAIDCLIVNIDPDPNAPHDEPPYHPYHPNPMFKNCNSIKEIIIGNNVKKIPSYLFEGCIGVKSITIPEGITEIGEAAFSNCTALEKVYFNAINCSCEIFYMDPRDPYGDPYYLTPMFSGCSAIKEVIIGNSVKQIPSYAFSGRRLITSITIPESVTEIGYEAFSGCTGLTSITIPENITQIGEYAFSGCTYLETIYFNATNCSCEVYDPEVDFWHGNCMFVGCSAIKDIIFGSNVKKIPSYSFAGCTGLTSIIVPESVTGIGEDSFGGCTGLTSITIPENVTVLGTNAFENCTSLEKVYFNAINCSTSYFDYSAFYGCSYIKEVIVGNSVKAIPSYAFPECTGLTSVIIPENVTEIGGDAFYGCPNLTLKVVENSCAHQYAIDNSLKYSFVKIYDDYVVDGATLIKLIDNPNYLITTYYDENNIIIDCKITEISEIGNIPLTYEQKGAKVKVMVWDSLNSIKPMIDTLEYSPNSI